MYQKYKNTIYDKNLIVNIFEILYFSNNFKKSNLVENYIVQDDDTPETISILLYKKPEYSWYILLLNNIQNYYEDWPIKQQTLIDLINNKYNQTTIVLNPNKTKNINFKKIHFIKIGNLTYPLLNYNKTLNKLTISKIFQINDTTIDLLDKNEVLIESFYENEYNISFDDKFGLNYFKNNNEIVSPYDEVFPGVTYLKNYSTGDESFAITNQKYEIEKNDKKRNILLFKPPVLDQVVSESYSLLKGSLKKNNILNFISNKQTNK